MMWPITPLWPKLNELDWLDSEFSLEKAYVCALFSELAYKRIADFELDDAKRANLIPCNAHRAISTGAETFDFDAALASEELGEYFTVIRRYSIVVGVRTPNVIFVSMRGTSNLYDLLVDIDARYVMHSDNGNIGAFHSGFYQAVEECRRPVIRALAGFLESGDVPVYVTGHSLGGAMAAVVNAIWKDGLTITENTQNPLNIHSAYAFGMPRYGDKIAVQHFRAAYHLLNVEDPIPNLPPQWMGFKNPMDERQLDGSAVGREEGREPYDLGNWLYHLATFRPLKNHAMELYRERIADTLGIS